MQCMVLVLTSPCSHRSCAVHGPGTYFTAPVHSPGTYVAVLPPLLCMVLILTMIQARVDSINSLITLMRSILSLPPSLPRSPFLAHHRLVFDAMCDIFYSAFPLISLFLQYFTLYVDTWPGYDAKLLDRAKLAGINGQDVTDIPAFLLIGTTSVTLFGGTSVWDTIVKVFSRVSPLVFAPIRLRAAFSLSMSISRREERRRETMPKAVQRVVVAAAAAKEVDAAVEEDAATAEEKSSGEAVGDTRPAAERAGVGGIGIGRTTDTTPTPHSVGGRGGTRKLVAYRSRSAAPIRRKFTFTLPPTTHIDQRASIRMTNVFTGETYDAPNIRTLPACTPSQEGMVGDSQYGGEMKAGGGDDSSKLPMWARRYTIGAGNNTGVTRSDGVGGGDGGHSAALPPWAQRHSRKGGALTNSNIPPPTQPVSRATSLAATLRSVSDRFSRELHTRPNEGRLTYYKQVPWWLLLLVFIVNTIFCLFVMVHLFTWGTCNGDSDQHQSNSICLARAFPVFVTSEHVACSCEVSSTSESGLLHHLPDSIACVRCVKCSVIHVMS